MAAIIQADPYQTLSRKIGYSVGLENLRERVKQLVSLYSGKQGLSLADFKDLVEIGWGRKKGKAKTAPYEHFANFYSTLNLVRLFGRDIEPLYQLDSLSILRSLLGAQEDKYDRAVKVVLAQSIIESDGDVFLNGLQSEFDPLRFEALLKEMVEEKWRRLDAVFPSLQLRAKLRQLVSIKNQSVVQDEGQKTRRSSSADRFTRRTTPLTALRRTSLLSNAPAGVVEIPEDYLDKVRSSRRGWAIDLGLFDAKGRTEQGTSLLEHLILQHVVSSDGIGRVALFWGYTSNLRRIRIEPKQLSSEGCEAWDLLIAISQGYSPESKTSPARMDPYPDVVDFLADVFRLYRKARTDKALIRNSLPMYIAEPVLVAWCVAQGVSIPPLHDTLEREFKKQTRRRVQKMKIRDTAGALFFMS